MRYRPLGPTGTVISGDALGTVTFGLETPEDESFAMLDHYVAAGGNLLDTGDVYAAGRSEEIIGAWLRSRPAEAAKCVLATKGRFPTGTGPNDLGASRRHLARALDASLSRLGVDRVDLYQVHAWDPITPLEETLRFLDDAITAGKIDHYGVSNFTGWQLTKTAHLADAHGMPRPVTVQLQFNLLVRGIEAEILPAARDAGVGVLAWSPLAGGWLTGKYARDVPPAGASRYAENPARGIQSWQDRNASERTWRVLDAVRSVADERSVPMAHVALAWLRQQDGVSAVLLGARTSAQLTEGLASGDLTLTEAELTALGEASIPQLEEYPYGAAGAEQRHRRIEGGR